MYTWQHRSDTIVVAAISVGIESSSYAFSLVDKYHDDPLSVRTINRYTSGHLICNSIPTTILFDGNKHFHSFGHDAESYYEDTLGCDTGENWYYFTGFTSLLREQTGSICDSKLKDVRGRELPAVDVFSAAIEYLKSDCMKYVKDYFVQEEDFYWIIMVPDVSSDATKPFLQKAAIKAGITKARLLLASESDAAFMCCEHVFFENSNGYHRKPGTKHVLVNASGCVNVSVLGVQSDAIIKTLDFHGEIAGQDQVFDAFKGLLTDIVGESTMRSFNKGDPDDVKQLDREIILKLWTKDYGNSVTMKVPLVLKNIFEENTGADLNETIKQSKYAGKVRCVSDKLRMNSDIYESLLQVCVVDTITTIKSFLDRHKPIDSIMLVGSFAKCPYLQQKVCKAFPDIKKIIPPDTGFAALVGAVITGHNPVYSAVPFARYTYGFATYKRFIPGIHSVDKKVIVKNRAYCKDVFEKHVEIGEILNPEIPQCDKIYKPSKAGKTYLELPVFASSIKDPLFVTDKSCFQIAQVKVILPDAYSEDKLLINVKLHYGYRKLEVEAQDIRNDKKLLTTYAVEKLSKIVILENN